MIYTLDEYNNTQEYLLILGTDKDNNERKLLFKTSELKLENKIGQEIKSIRHVIKAKTTTIYTKDKQFEKFLENIDYSKEKEKH